MGQIYVEVDANMANGISTMAASGQTPVGGFVNWSSQGGIQGAGWEYMKSYIAGTGWPTLAQTTIDPETGQSYSGDYAGFIKYIESAGLGLEDRLDAVFSDENWDQSSKMSFVRSLPESVYNACVTF